nr:DnaJ domain-containing protein [Tanacetum cinerariifolium]
MVYGRGLDVDNPTFGKCREAASGSTKGRKGPPALQGVLCVGKGCPYSCVNTAPHAFNFSTSTGTAQATSQGHGEDYQVQLAVGQCPRSCIHYVTPSQRVILEELLGSILNMPFDCSAEADLLYSLIVKAKFENNRYKKPKKQPKASTKHVDLY